MLMSLNIFLPIQDTSKDVIKKLYLALHIVILVFVFILLGFWCPTQGYFTYTMVAGIMVKG